MLEVRHLKKEYRTKNGAVTKALDDVSLVFPERGMVFILGKSGSGKSTLLNVCGGLDKYDSGEIIIKGKSSSEFSGQDFDSYRNTYVGFVFQEYNILDEFTVEENIALALELQNKKRDKAAIAEILEAVDMTQFAARKPNTLSGGQKQRVAIARALVKAPEIIMADEPTGALDSKTGQQVFDTLKKLSRDKLVLVVSHDREFAEQYGDRVIELKDGVVISDMARAEVDPDAKNVRFYGADTVCVTNGAELTDDDMKRIREFLGKTSGAAVITTSREQIKYAKEAQPELDVGEFETLEKQPEPKQYPAQTLIRSRFPLKHAIRVGASGLKTKPVRLVFTLLLSIIAFVMFGLASTVMVFDKTKVTIESLATSGDTHVALGKAYRYTTYYYEDGVLDDQYEDIASTNYTAEEYEKLKRKYPGAVAAVGERYDPVIRIDNVSLSQNASNFYSSGACYAAISDDSIKLHAGRLPTAVDEIAISDYMFRGFALSHTVFERARGGGENARLTFTDYNSIVKSDDPVELRVPMYLDNGMTQTLYLKIVGVVDTGFDGDAVPNKYAALEQAATDNTSFSDYLTQFTWKNFVCTCLMGMPVVCEEFVDTYLKPRLRGRVRYFEYTYGLDVRVPGLDGMTVGGISKCATDNALALYDLDGAPVSRLTGNSIGISGATFAGILFDALEQRYSTEIEDYYAVINSDEYGRAVDELSKAYENAHPRPEFPQRDDGMTDEEYEQKVEEYNEANAAYEAAFDAYIAAEKEKLCPKPKAMRREELRERTYVEYAAVHPEPDSSDYEIEDDYWTDFWKYRDAIESYIMEVMLQNGYASSAVDGIYGRSDVPVEKQKDVVEKLIAEYEAAGLTLELEYTVHNDRDNSETTVSIGALYYSTAELYNSSDVYAYVSDELYDRFADNLHGGSGYYSIDETKYKAPVDAYIAMVLVPISGSRAVITELVNGTSVIAADDSTTMIHNAVMTDLRAAFYMVDLLGSVFLYAGIALAAFAFLLMFNFISASISAKKKDIGILRAIGARAVDVFKIFISEALIISSICILVSIAATAVLCFVINGIVAANMSIALFVFGPLSVAFIVAIALVTAFVATIIPVANYTKKPPISSIRAL